MVPIIKILFILMNCMTDKKEVLERVLYAIRFWICDQSIPEYSKLFTYNSGDCFFIRGYRDDVVSRTPGIAENTMHAIAGCP